MRLGLNIGGGLVLGGDMYLVHCAGVVEVCQNLFSLSLYRSKLTIKKSMYTMLQRSY